MIIYITAGDGDFNTDIQNQCIVLLYKKVHVIVTMSSLISELPFSSSKNSNYFLFLLDKYE